MSLIDVTTPAGNAAETGSHIVRTRYGIEFDAREDWWPIDGKQGIDVAAIRSLVSPGLLPGLESTLRQACAKYSWATLNMYGYGVKTFRKECFPDGLITSWNLADFRRYRTILLEQFGHEDALRHLRSLLANWHQAKHSGVSDDLMASLKEMKLKGVEAGRAVRVMDPDEGPLTPQQAHHLIQDLNDAAEAGKLTISEFSLAYFHLCTGRRPVQSAALKCKDVIEGSGEPEPGFPNGRPIYLIAVPRAKQRGHTFRESRRAIDLTEDNYQVFKAQRESIKQAFAEQLERGGWQLQSQDLQDLLGELPLYPIWPTVVEALELASQMRQRGEHGKALQALQMDVKGMAWHGAPLHQSNRLRAIYSAVQMHRAAEDRIPVSANRLRYTKGTDLAREGLPANLIAWLLDHSTSRSAEIYVDNLPEHAAEISRAVSTSLTLQRFASAFRGTLVDSEADAVAGGDPESRVAYKGQNAATCGHLKQCGLDGGLPHACYTCSHFQPWLDGPHAEFLAELQAERADQVAQLGADSPVAKRRDKLIGAVERVILLCDARRAELSERAV
ncbi:hypothetical protein E2K99_02180 [Herbaspirillum huttiense]|uniref:site-specific integrase n=1 Tax=Herbaspirillum huttiense TaxID=863372 RepID=UPI001065211D|nr:site-specific integrase [Herbaspirillum huttiense]QBP73890.1 hypothetical protein E2K99_02180 [Herbaspirillum huttiense]